MSFTGAKIFEQRVLDLLELQGWLEGILLRLRLLCGSRSFLSRSGVAQALPTGDSGEAARTNPVHMDIIEPLA